MWNYILHDKGHQTGANHRDILTIDTYHQGILTDMDIPEKIKINRV